MALEALELISSQAAKEIGPRAAQFLLLLDLSYAFNNDVPIPSSRVR